MKKVTDKEQIELSPSPLVKYLDKPATEFTREDLVRFVSASGTRNIHFRYAAFDGKLKELNLPVNNLYELEKILAEGERVDGSSLFPKLFDAGESDLYVVPVYKTAFVNPFYPNTLDVMCRFFDRHGKRCAVTPDNVVWKAHKLLQEKTGLDLRALGELEFYIISDPTQRLFPCRQQRGYHESGPFITWSKTISEMTNILAEISGCVKYSHSEVGNIPPMRSESKELDGKVLEQHEIEFLPAPVEDMADYVQIAKWVIRNVAARNGAQVTFAPKIDEGDAGSGMHFHVELRRDGRNVMTDNKGALSTEALKLVGGMVAMSKSLTAFGNTVSCAYMRLVPHQEAPTRICWSESNRSALIRVPLGWRGLNNLAHQTNPQQKAFFESKHGRQTVELRSPDGSADSSLLLAGMTLAAYQGLTSKDSLKVAEQSHVTGNIFHDEKVLAKLDSLPESCWASAQALQKQRALYEENDVFPPKLIDLAIRRLEEQNDKNLNAELRELSNKNRLERAREIMFRNLHVS